MRLRREDEATRQAVGEVVKTTEKLVVDRLTLLQHDVMDEVRHFGSRIIQHGLSLLFGLSAWVVLTAGFVLALAEVMPAFAAALAVGGAYAAAALGLVWYAKRRRGLQAKIS